MTSVVVRWLAAGAVAAGLGVLPATATVATADPQCSDPAMCQALPNPENCNGTADASVCTREWDAELHSEPNPNDIPQVPQAETPPWQVGGVPGVR